MNDYFAFEKVICRVGEVYRGHVFTEELLRKTAQYNRSLLLHYDEATQSLVWRGLLWGEKLPDNRVSVE